MKIIDLKQNSPEWLKFRREKIGASDAPIIMGVSPWKTLPQLYREKIEGIESYKNEAMQRGNELEPLARKAFEEAQIVFNGCLDAHLVPMVVQSDDYEWLIASLDGIDIKNKILLEVKCPGEKDHAIAKEGKIPPKYYPQLQQQMYITDYEEANYQSFRSEQDWCTVKCKRNDEYINKMLVKASEFWQMLQTRTPPVETEIVDRKDEEFEEIAQHYIKAKLQLLAFEKEEAELRARLIDASRGECCTGGGIKLMQQERKGNVDYSKIPQLRDVDLESFRKPSTKFWTVTLTESA